MILKPVHLLVLTILVIFGSLAVGVYNINQKTVVELPDTTATTSDDSVTINTTAFLPAGLLKSKDRSTVDLRINGKGINAEIVNTTTSRALGLSGRAGLDDNMGMIFIFNEPDFYSFWMKDMKFSIDMIWIDQFGTIVHIEKNVSPNTFPKGFEPAKPAQAVLEMEAGFSERNGLKVGDSVSM